MEIHIARDGQRYGPYTEEQARAYLEQGQLLPNDLAWKEGMAEWQPLSDVLGLNAGGPPPVPGGGSLGGISDKTLAMLAHLLPIFTGFLAPLIIWLIKKDDPRAGFVIGEAKEALNFQITVAIAIFACIMLSFIIIGGFLMPVVAVGNIVFCILAAIKANDGIPYRYPVAIRLVK